MLARGLTGQATHGAAGMPADGRQPTLVGAIALILGYFALQLAIAVPAFALARLLAGRFGIAFDDARLYALLAILLLSPLVVLTAIRYVWPAMWALATPPGLGWCAPRGGGAYVLAAALVIAVPLVSSALTALLAHGHPVDQDVHQWLVHASLPPQILMMVVAVTLAPAVEELMFRGVLLSALLRRLRAGWAVGVCAAAFALVHLPDFAYHWYPLPGLALLGAVAAWLRLRSGSIRPALLLHAGNNLCAVLVWMSQLHGTQGH